MLKKLDFTPVEVLLVLIEDIPTREAEGWKLINNKVQCNLGRVPTTTTWASVRMWRDV